MRGTDQEPEIERGHMRPVNGRPRAPLKPVPEGWRRLVLLGTFALALLGVLSTVGAVYLLIWFVTSSG